MDRNTGQRGHLDPTLDPARWESLVGGIMEASEHELARRRDQMNFTSTLLVWARPALSAAATIAVLLSVTAALVSRPGAGDMAEPLLADALVPGEVAQWLVAGYQPTVTEVVAALEEVVR